MSMLLIISLKNHEVVTNSSKCAFMSQDLDKAANADKIRADLALADSQRGCAELKAKVKSLEAIIEQQRHHLKTAGSRLADVERERKDLDVRDEKLKERENSLKAAEVELRVEKASFMQGKRKFEEKQRAARAVVDDIKRAAQTLESGYSSDGPSAASLPNGKPVYCDLEGSDVDDINTLPDAPNRKRSRISANPHGGQNARAILKTLKFRDAVTRGLDEVHASSCKRTGLEMSWKLKSDARLRR
ncbi:hypothetical protein C8R45DRAFT_935415 [Mycena sanguinolenta]|nr:hypothetical protein C8R45DRAFT_935415 [Mycena sanguinolenta]